MVLAMILGVVTFPAHALVLRRSPKDLGLLPDGAPPEAAVQTVPETGATLSEALRDPAFWWLNTGFFLGTAASVAIGLYLIPLLVERGETLALATMVTGLIGAAQTGGRFAITGLERRAPAAVSGALIFALQAVAIALITLSIEFAVLLVAIVLLGIGRGGATLMRATLVADRYGRGNFATISGIPAATQMAARAIAPVGAGLLVSWWGGYTPMLVVLTGMAGVATLAMVMYARSARPLRRVGAEQD